MIVEQEVEILQRHSRTAFNHSRNFLLCNKDVGPYTRSSIGSVLFITCAIMIHSSIARAYTFHSSSPFLVGQHRCQQQQTNDMHTIRINQSTTTTTRRTPSTLRMARYGPKEDMPTDMEGDFFANQEEWEKENKIRFDQQKIEFQKLLDEIIATEDVTHLPGLMSKNVDLLLSMRGFEGVSLLKEAIETAEKSGDEEMVERVSNAVEYILSFIEEFVDQAVSIDKANKELLGKIIRAMTGQEKKNDSDEEVNVEVVNEDEVDDEQRAEERLDKVLEEQKENFTPGFLRHIEGECARIAGAPRMTPESARLLQMMRVIQARVVEELGKDLGEGALVLGQLLGYDDKTERLAVLDAGLKVRGISFARELSALTKEALEGFQNVPGGADPGLVARVTEIDGRIDSFIDKSTTRI